MSLPPAVHRSDERLTHFRCADPKCDQWWSIADFDTPPGRWSRPYILCPRCGKQHRLNEVDEGVLAA